MLAREGLLMTKLQPWLAYLDEADLETVREILSDIEAFDGHRVPAGALEATVAEVALLTVLTTRALMT